MWKRKTVAETMYRFQNNSLPNKLHFNFIFHELFELLSYSETLSNSSCPRCSPDQSHLHDQNSTLIPSRVRRWHRGLLSWTTTVATLFFLVQSPGPSIEQGCTSIGNQAPESHTTVNEDKPVSSCLSKCSQSQG